MGSTDVNRSISPALVLAYFQHSKGVYAPGFEPQDLLKLDLLVAPDAGRDIGCCAHGSAPLEVGVDARRRFPEERATGYSGPRREDQ